MMKPKGNVLAVIELENDPDRTLERAIWIADLLDRGIDILLCEQDSGTMLDGYALSNVSEQLRSGIRDVLDNILSEFAGAASRAGLQVTTSLLEQRPIGDGIMSRAMDTDPSVVVKGTHFHSVAERSILVNTDWQLMRACPYPLWLVKSPAIREIPVVVASVDPLQEHDKSADLDQSIVKAALRIAHPKKGDVHLFHSYERLTALGTAANRAITSAKLPIDELDERMKREHAEALLRLAQDNCIDEDHTHQMPGRTHELLPVFARSRKADVVVMGAVARWSLKRMIIGSTAEKTLDHLPCDVLIVRANEYALDN